MQKKKPTKKHGIKYHLTDQHVNQFLGSVAFYIFSATLTVFYGTTTFAAGESGFHSDGSVIVSTVNQAHRKLIVI